MRFREFGNLILIAGVENFRQETLLRQKERDRMGAARIGHADDAGQML
jgi:hypothetical protein